jgi:hypothetical protein
VKVRRPTALDIEAIVLAVLMVAAWTSLVLSLVR